MTHLASILAFVCYPLLTYVAVVTGRPGLALLALGLTVLPFLSRRRAGASKYFFLLFLLLTVLASVEHIRIRQEWPVLLYLPPIIISGFLLWAFGRTLRRGREPIITTFCRMQRGDLPEELIRYTRRLTWFWTGILAALTLNSVLLAAFAPIRIWALFTNLLNYLIIVILFGIEYVYRRYRFRHVSHAAPFAFVANLTKGEGWALHSPVAKAKSGSELTPLHDN